MVQSRICVATDQVVLVYRWTVDGTGRQHTTPMPFHILSCGCCLDLPTFSLAAYLGNNVSLRQAGGLASTFPREDWAAPRPAALRAVAGKRKRDTRLAAPAAPTDAVLATSYSAEPYEC